MRRLFVLAAGLAASTHAGRSSACAVCATGDTTLTPVGHTQPFAGRVQTTLDYRQGAVEAGGASVEDHRLEVAALAAVGPEMLVTLGVPLLERDLGAPNERTLHAIEPGDVQLRFNRVHASWDTGGLRQRFGVMVALDLPTAPLESGASGAPLASALQPGCGSFVPAGGFDYVIGRGAWSEYAALSVWLPFAIRSGYHAGDSIRTSVRAQVQPLRALGLRAGADVVEASGDHRVVGPLATATLTYDF